MRCPFRWKAPKRKFSFGVDGGFVDFVEELDQKAEEAYYAKYDTCWKRFKHWLTS